MRCKRTSKRNQKEVPRRDCEVLKGLRRSVRKRRRGQSEPAAGDAPS